MGRTPHRVVALLQVKGVLGIKATSILGPGGEEHWEDVSREAQRETDDFLR